MTGINRCDKIMMTGEIPVEFPFYALGSLNSIPGVFLILIKYSLQCDKMCDRIIDERATSAFKLGQKYSEER